MQNKTGGICVIQEKTKEFEMLKLPCDEKFDYKGMRYIIRHTYKNSGENLINVLKDRFLKSLSNIDIEPILCYNQKVNIFGD